MISPQNLAIAAAVVGMEGKESVLFRKVIWWSLGLLLGMCVLVYLQSTPVLGWMVVADRRSQRTSPDVHPAARHQVSSLPSPAVRRGAAAGSPGQVAHPGHRPARHGATTPRTSLLTPQAVADARATRPRSAGCSPSSAAHGRAADVPVRRHQPVAGRRSPTASWSTPAGTSGTSRCSTTAPGCGSARARRCGRSTPGWPGYGRKLGPDPASEIACTLGGVVANNSSGMACGTVANTYNTLDSLVLVLPSGTVVDTGAADADERLRALRARAVRRVWPGCATGCAATRRRCAPIEQQFSMKNTMGYGLNSLLDHTRPVDILAHLVVGSEGTLAFVASVVMRTVPLLPHAMTGLLVFDDLQRRNRVAARPGRDRAGHHRTAGRRVAAGRAGRPAGRRERCGGSPSTGTPPCWSSTRPTRPPRSPSSAPRRTPVLAGAAGHRPGGAHRRPAARGPRCGTPARACTPRSPGPARPAPPRCWRTSSSRCRRCWTPASG